MPFLGDLRHASVYILLLNPGLGATDYFGEYEVPAFRRATIDNLHQKPGRPYPFYVLDPRFAWHGGFQWWNQKLSDVVVELAARWNVSFAEARRRAAQQIACIELLPYHSSAFADRGRWRNRLTSCRLAVEFVHSHALSRVKADEASVIVTRQVKQWGLPAHRNIIAFLEFPALTGHRVSRIRVRADDLIGYVTPFAAYAECRIIRTKIPRTNSAMRQKAYSRNFVDFGD